MFRNNSLAPRKTAGGSGVRRTTSSLYARPYTGSITGCAMSKLCADRRSRPYQVSNFCGFSNRSPSRALDSEFLGAAKLEGKNFAATRIAEQHYLSVALKAWAALKAARDQSDPSLLEIHNQAIANYLQFASPADLAIGRADEVVDGRHIKIILRDEAKPDSPPGFDQLVPSERLTIRGLRERYVRAGLGGRLVCQQEPDSIRGSRKTTR